MGERVIQTNKYQHEDRSQNDGSMQGIIVLTVAVVVDSMGLKHHISACILGWGCPRSTYLLGGPKMS